MSQRRRIVRASQARHGQLVNASSPSLDLANVRVLMPREDAPASAHKPRLLTFARALVAGLAAVITIGWLLAALSGCEGMLIFTARECEEYCEGAGLTVRSWDPNALHCECWGGVQ